MNYYIFGLQRSGTNYLEQLVNQNFSARRVNRTNRCWKHSIDIPEGYNPNVPTILISKNPYTWVESICFRNTVDWIKSQTKYPAEEGPDEFKLGPKNINIENLAKTYKHFHNTWVPDLENRYAIRYEELLITDKRVNILNDISKLLPKRKSNEWINPQRGKVSQSRDYNEEREQYYLDMKPQKLNEFHIKTINDVLGDMIEQMGYTKL